MNRTTTPSFCLTLSLRCEVWQRDRLDKIFKVAGFLYNSLVEDRQKALFQIERTRRWKSIQSELALLYKAKEDDTITKEQEKQFKELLTQRKNILKENGMNEYAFQSRILKWRNHYQSLIGVHVAQKIASAVWKKFDAYWYSNGEEVSFKSWTEFRSIESKTNEANIRYSASFLCLNGMKISVRQPANEYEEEALSNRVKYCRIIRLPWRDGWLYRLQLVLEGTPPVKRNKNGERRYPVGQGRVGIDLGTQTVAVSGESAVLLEELADKANQPNKILRRINRAIDRSRRATNPDMFNEDGTVIPINKLPAERLTRGGKRRWVRSKNCLKLEMQRRWLYAKLARIRKMQHGAMANRYVQFGSEFFVETMQFQSLAKKAKDDKKDESKSKSTPTPKPKPKQDAKPKRRKRFGKSIANKAPAMFLNILEKKLEEQGGKLIRINTQKAKASQYNHLNRRYDKKKLSQRWQIFDDGTKVQRDLYSAFLIMNTNETLDGFDQTQCEATFANFLRLHALEIERLKTIHTPSSTGVSPAA